jgi:UDP-4-amino-4,6-dideoxy-N-acetyl-beta-L-altrosamine N-acetyltransferase
MSIPVYSLRPVGDEECLQVLAWRNAPQVRQAMLTKDEISVDNHRAWWARKQADPAFRMLITEADGVPIAVQIFFDVTPQTAWWAFYFTDRMPSDLGAMMAHWRFVEAAGIGYGFHIIGLETLLCEVLRSNDAVLRWHRRFGFAVLPREVSDSPLCHDLEVLGMSRRDYDAACDRTRDLRRWEEVTVTLHPFDAAHKGGVA